MEGTHERTPRRKGKLLRSSGPDGDFPSGRYTGSSSGRAWVHSVTQRVLRSAEAYRHDVERAGRSHSGRVPFRKVYTGGAREPAPGPPADVNREGPRRHGRRYGRRTSVRCRTPALVSRPASWLRTSAAGPTRLPQTLAYPLGFRVHYRAGDARGEASRKSLV